MNQTKLSPKNMTVGLLAKSADVNVETVRYYQGLGLIKTPDKPRQGYRQYSYDVVKQIVFIKRAQQLGFSLQEISELLKIGTGHCHDIRQRAEQKRDKINKQIRDLEVLKNTLEQLIHNCTNEKNKQNCPLIESLLLS